MQETAKIHEPELQNSRYVWNSGAALALQFIAQLNFSLCLGSFQYHEFQPCFLSDDKQHAKAVRSFQPKRFHMFSNLHSDVKAQTALQCH
jgi:hypothetical protein